MPNSSVALYGGFALAAAFLIGGLILVLIGARMFARGTGIQKLKDHSFEVLGGEF